MQKRVFYIDPSNTAEVDIVKKGGKIDFYIDFPAFAPHLGLEPKTP